MVLRALLELSGQFLQGFMMDSRRIHGAVNPSPEVDPDWQSSDVNARVGLRGGDSKLQMIGSPRSSGVERAELARLQGNS